MKTYTFHVSLPGYGRVWRKIELPAENTLEDLHWAIQDAFDFDGDHLYSFFMSGRFWDPATEYALPEGADLWDFGDEEEGEIGESEEAMGADLAEEEGLPPEEMEAMARFQAALGDAPIPSNVSEVLRLMGSNPAVRDVFAQRMSADLHIPLADVSQFLDMIGAMASDLSAAGMTLLFNEDEARDVRTATLESLELKKGKTFAYLFDYGDEWRFKVRVHAINPTADDAAEYPLLVEAVGEAPEQYPNWEEEMDEEEEDSDF